MHIVIHILIYIHIYICTYIHICTYTYTCIHAHTHIMFMYKGSVSSSRGNKGRLTLVQFNGLFNETITVITRSTKHREGINPNENALKTQLIRLQLHIIQVH